MNAQLRTATAMPSRPGNVPAPVCDDAPLTRVTLIDVPWQFVVSLRFGHPVRELPLDRTRCIAAFLPGARFARIRWEAGDGAPTCWQLLVLQACTQCEPMQRFPGIDPGAGVLLRAEGPREVRVVLSKLDAIEARGIDPVDVAPAYWRLLAGRLAAHQLLPDYTAARHAAWRSGRALR